VSRGGRRGVWTEGRRGGGGEDGRGRCVILVLALHILSATWEIEHIEGCEDGRRMYQYTWTIL